MSSDPILSASQGSQALLAALRDEIELLRSEHERACLERDRYKLERDHYKSQLDARLRAIYAARSEARLSQQSLIFDEAEAQAELPAPGVAETDTVPVTAHRKRKPGRKPLDPKLPREVVRVELPIEQRVCAHDGTALIEIGVEASEQLEVVPAQLKVIRTERVKYACPCCDQSLKVAKAPSALVPRSVFTANTLAWVISAKYQDALPLYRQASILSRCGGDIARNTLATAVVRIGQAVQPVINLLQDYCLAADVLHVDETVVQVLKEPGRTPQSQSYFWIRATGSGPPVRLFTYAPSRSGKTALELLQEAQGAVMTDGYEPYNAATQVQGLVHLGCWVHARRGFIKTEESLPKEQRGSDHPASRMIALIRELYAIEDHATEQGFTCEQRTALRRDRSTPVVARIRQQLETLLPNALPQSELGKALAYLHGQWSKLIRFLGNGAWPLDNNLAENAIRPFVVGRKNWLFADTVHGANASANLYSLIETAKANSLDPYHYLAHLFTELPKAHTFDQIERLLPWNLRAAT
jgi:transposase